MTDNTLPEGWREEDAEMIGKVVRYWEAVEGFDAPTERVVASSSGVRVLSVPRHWPTIPVAVLIRAAQACHRLRYGGLE